jgi:hypothetical protein
MSWQDLVEKYAQIYRLSLGVLLVRFLVSALDGFIVFCRGVRQ